MRQVRLAITLLFLSTMMLSCTSREERARALHSESLEAKRSGNPVRHEELLQRIVSDYPSTVTAAEAQKELEDIRLSREALISNTVGVMRIILTGQALFFNGHGRYAQSLDELCASKRGGFDRGFLDPEKGYQYEMQAGEEKYVVTATPTLPTLKKYFFMDTTGYIHEETGKPATVESPITTY